VVAIGSARRSRQELWMTQTTDGRDRRVQARTGQHDDGSDAVYVAGVLLLRLVVRCVDKQHVCVCVCVCVRRCGCVRRQMHL